MKSPVLLLLALAFAIKAEVLFAASTDSLAKYKSKQLIACFDNKSVCGVSDMYQISEELVRRLPKLSDQELVKCLGHWKVCGVGNSEADGWAVSEELARRGDPHRLLELYWIDTDILVRDGIMHVAYKFKTPEVVEFMKLVLAAGKGDEDALYWPANYLTKDCDPDGLKWLSERQGRPENCMNWAPTVALFRKCNYRPAIPYIVSNSIWDACLDIDDEGVRDLQHFFPHSPKRFKDMEEMQDYFCARAKREGFRVHCTSN